VQHSPILISGAYTFPLPIVDIDFDVPMDTGVVPADASLEVVVDGTPQTPTVGAWQDSDTLRLNIVGSALSTLVVNLLVQDSNLRSSVGSLAHAPQTVTIL